jgi:hypothetical protein
MADRDEADIPETCSSNSSLQLFVSKNGHATVSGPDTRLCGHLIKSVVYLNKWLVVGLITGVQVDTSRLL